MILGLSELSEILAKFTSELKAKRMVTDKNIQTPFVVEEDFKQLIHSDHVGKKNANGDSISAPIILAMYSKHFLDGSFID